MQVGPARHPAAYRRPSDPAMPTEARPTYIEAAAATTTGVDGCGQLAEGLDGAVNDTDGRHADRLRR